MFVGEVGEDLVCSICQDVLDGATLSGCSHQHAYCRRCLLQWSRRANVARTCPDCRQAVEERGFAPLKLLDRMVGRLKVNCKNAGCHWQGEHSDLAAHLASNCLRQPKPCQNADRGCLDRILPNMMHFHINSVCKYVVVACSRGGNDCGGPRKGVYLRRDEVAHAEVCKQHRCKNKGCTLVGRLNTLKLHQNGCDAVYAARARAESQCTAFERDKKVLSSQNATLKIKAEKVLSENKTLKEENKKLKEEVARLKAPPPARPLKREADVLNEVKEEEQDRKVFPRLALEVGDRRSSRLRAVSK